MCKAIEGIMQMGIEQGMVRGIAQGIEQKQREVSLRMAAEGMAASLIARLVDAREEVVENWILEAAHS